MNIKQIVKEIFSSIKRDWYLPVTEHQVYSEQEQVVGIWTDGKPIYRKTFETSFGVGANNIDIGALNIDKLLDSYGVFNRIVSATKTIWQNYNFNVSGNIYGAIQHDITNGVEVLQSVIGLGSSEQTNKQYITIEYTKTTDTPTTKKVPFEPLIEYSTDEKMIGYWVDGKPLYRRVFKFDTFYSKGSNTLIANFKSSFNIDNVSRFYGTATSNNGSIYNLTDIGQDGKSGVEIEKNGALMFYVSNSTGVTWKPCVTIEYTKTTD